MTKIEHFFARYQEAANSFDPELVCSQYTAEFMGGGPNGVACGRNDEAFRTAIARRHALFQEIGFKRAEILSVQATPLDEWYTMAKVHWHMTFEKQSGRSLDFKFFLTYFLFDSGSGPKVVFWISHDDEQKVLREAGLIPAVAQQASTRIKRHVNAPRAAVYRALLDPNAIATWKVPTSMGSQVHAFNPREGGFFRVSLTYEVPTNTGKTSAHTDTYHGRFAKLVPNEQVVEVVEFETADPAMCGEMTITISLTDAEGGTDILAVHEGLPRGVSPADNETGWRQALAKLAALVEANNGASSSHSV